MSRETPNVTVVNTDGIIIAFADFDFEVHESYDPVSGYYKFSPRTKMLSTISELFNDRWGVRVMESFADGSCTVEVKTDQFLTEENIMRLCVRDVNEN